MSKNIKSALQRARLLIRQGNLSEAIAILEDLRSHHHDDFDVVYMLGVVQGITGDLDQALDTLTQATMLQPGHVKAHNVLGIVFIRKGDLNSALDHFDWVLKLDPMDLEAMRQRGTVLKDLGRFNEAIEQWKTMEGGANDASDVQCGLGFIYKHRGELGKAEQHYCQVLRLPGETEFHETARRGLIQILETTRDRHDLRMNVVMFCLVALERFSRMDRKKLHRVLLEIALMGRAGLDVNDLKRPRFSGHKMRSNFPQEVSHEQAAETEQSGARYAHDLHAGVPR